MSLFTWIIFVALLTQCAKGNEVFFPTDTDDIEFRSSVFKYEVEGGNEALASTDFNIRLKLKWIQEKGKGQDLPFDLGASSEVHKK